MSRSHPENQMAAAIGCFMLALVGIGIAVSFGAAWLIWGWGSVAFWAVGLGAGPIVGIAVLIAVFPDLGRSWLDRNFPPSFAFHLPEGFRGRFYILGLDGGTEVVREAGAYRFDVPASRVLRVKRFKGIDNAFARLRVAGGAEIHRDQQGMSSSPETGRIDYLSFYVGTADEWQRDTPSAPDFAEQVRRVESGQRP